ncbi:AraC family transcriptional regulator [Clostridium beijerinckii]|uniref:AraC family transcriptional regulator n=1 Tax=Clostridium beijerinckii TaxID=1520 RepID=A0A1B9BG46_CLOBE|nr:AraC family transcriptional regulator [Clostridium beijerinckii]MBA2887781.1 AraC family transcriptional regulator [Clostridium beijerinckii]MBA2901704.1 AraC family transcriptional regulator [Clostridium beijerinckii]MBA2911408.1 AraC family transcriptional regulator [Clostridium beijerinckii]MBA9013730.1 AraC family transcriptional regulator [Clostridium beijerinckii]MBC2417313.1 AraC family transcriptional regulator [Clostridium beijerinckii]
MKWIEGIGEAISYIEENITEEITIKNIAEKTFMSPFYFQKGFAMLCGFTVGEYIRQRRLTLAGSDLVSTDEKIIDIALKYGYASPDSFTKAFTRFHGVTPTAVRKDGAMIKSFAPLKIKFLLEGGYIMDYKIVEKDSFTVMGVSKIFKYENAFAEIPPFWTEHYEAGKGKFVCGMYGISIDESMGSDEFEYLIADDYNPSMEIPNGFVTKIIPKHTWAVFACKGAMPKSLQDMNRKIFSEWLPNCKDYEIAAGYNIEMYTDIADYPKGNQDENYYSEIWIPVKKK